MMGQHLPSPFTELGKHTACQLNSSIVCAGLLMLGFYTAVLC
jgi:hypothetical protein